MIMTSDTISSCNFYLSPQFKVLTSWGAKGLEYDVNLFLTELEEDDLNYVIHDIATVMHPNSDETSGEWYTSTIYYSKVKRIKEAHYE